MSTVTKQLAQHCLFSQFITASQNVTSRDSFSTLVYPVLTKILPHNHFMCGILSAHPPQILDSINWGFYEPQMINNLVIDLLAKKSHNWDSLGTKWRLFITDDFFYKEATLLNRWHPNFLQKNRSNNLLFHGLREIHGGASSFFCFSDVDATNEDGHTLLNLMIPHLHDAVCNHYRFKEASSEGGLSKRETEILELVRIGKTNQEIGLILGISVCTVKNHVRNLMEKLNVSTRGYAVVKATNMGLISMRPPTTIPSK